MSRNNPQHVCDSPLENLDIHEILDRLNRQIPNQHTYLEGDSSIYTTHDNVPEVVQLFNQLVEQFRQN